MMIAVMSDSHDHIWNVKKAVEIVREKQVEMIIHCGDFVAPFTLKELDLAGAPVHGVFGNNDGDRYLLTRLAMGELKNVTLHGLSGTVEAGGTVLGFSHYKEAADGLAVQGACGMVFYGHTHVHEIHEIAATPVLNPGEVMGKEGSPGFCLVDAQTLEWERVEL